MVVALHLERERPPISHLDHAGVLPWPLQHMRPLVREAAEERARVLVAAVFAPHYGEQRELQEVVCLLDIQTPAPTSTESSILNPSSEPRVGSETLSGCGMMPTTLRSSLQTPAMSFADPFGFSR